MIKVIKTSMRGAHLVTDGNKVAWIMGRCLRSNGTLTPMGEDALENGKDYADWEAEEKAREEAVRAAKEERERLYEASKEAVSVTIDARRIDKGTEKAWRVRADGKRVLYGRAVNMYHYLPKSAVSVQIDGNTATLTMPRWVLGGHAWLKEII